MVKCIVCNEIEKAKNTIVIVDTAQAGVLSLGWYRPTKEEDGRLLLDYYGGCLDLHTKKDQKAYEMLFEADSSLINLGDLLNTKVNDGYGVVIDEEESVLSINRLPFDEKNLDNKEKWGLMLAGYKDVKSFRKHVKSGFKKESLVSWRFIMPPETAKELTDFFNKKITPQIAEKISATEEAVKQEDSKA